MWEAAFGVAPIFGDLEQRLWQLFERGSANTYGASSLAVATLAASASSGVAPGDLKALMISSSIMAGRYDARDVLASPQDPVVHTFQDGGDAQGPK